MSRNTEISKEQGCDPLNGFNHKEKELSEKDKIQETHISLENAPVTLPPKMEFELNLNNRERINKEKAEVSTSPKKKLQPKKAEISIQKRQNIFNVEVAKCSEIQVTSKAKVPRSRKKLDENTNGQENPGNYSIYLLYKKVFKKPNGAKQMNKIIDKSNETHKNENDSTHMAQEKEKTSVKNSSSLSLISQQEPAILEKLNQCINKDLNRIYNEFIKLKVLGRKRMNSSKLEIGLDLDEKNLGKTYSTEVELKCRKQSINESPSKETLKYNLYNPNYENIFKKLDILKLFTNSSPDLDNEIYFNNIPNFYDDSIRREYANSLNFIKTFQEDYAPIQLQKDNEKFFEKIENEENFKTQSDAISVAGSISTEITSNQTISKTHFIKKKQSALNIKRRCGVSYVVQSESQQLNVEHKYSKLGHLIYQGTHSVDQIQDEQIIKYIDNLITTELTNSPVIAVAFESPDEVEMKNFLLFPSKRLEIAKEIFILETIDEIWKFSKDKFFFAINLLFDQDKGIRNFTVEELKRYSNKELLEMSEIHVGILFRKATSGIKSVLKLYKSGGFDKILHSSSYKLCNMNEEDSIDRNIEKYSGLNMTTMSMRIELYVPELQWKSAGVFTKEFLYTFICRLEEKISSLILNWNEYRYTMYLLTKDGKVREYIHNCPYYTLNSQITSNEIPSTKTQAGETKFELNLHHFNNIKDATFPKITENKIDLSKSELLSQSKIKVHNSFADKLSLINNLTFNNLPNPMYVISTRDCFVFDLIVKSEIFEFEGRKILKKEFFFHENNIPANFYKFQTDKNELRVGVVTYENFYTSDELDELENCVERTEEYSLKDAFLPETAQKTFSGDKIKRTKFFFGSRYMWTKKQLSEPNSYVGAGIRKDVSPPPFWMREKVEDPLVKAGIILKNFVNSFAMNVYHDGTEGLGQHFDDAVRFKQVNKLFYK